MGEFTADSRFPNLPGCRRRRRQGQREQKEDEGGGGGGGVCVTPIAFIVIKGGEISFHGIKQGEAQEGLFEHLPDLTEKILAKVHEAKAKGKQAEPEAG